MILKFPQRMPQIFYLPITFKLYSDILKFAITEWRVFLYCSFVVPRDVTHGADA